MNKIFSYLTRHKIISNTLVLCLILFNGCTKNIKTERTDENFSKGLYYFQVSEHDKAIDEFNVAIKKKPKFADGYKMRAYAKMAKGKYIEALSDLNIAVSIDPSNEYLYVDRGNCYLAYDKIEEAIKDYNFAISINTKFSLGYYNRGIAN